MRKSMKALLSAAVVGISTFAMAGAACAATYLPQKTVQYEKYEKYNKWIKRSEQTDSYNKKGQLVKRTLVEYDTETGKVEDTYVTTYTYKSGKLIKASVKNNKKAYSTITYKVKNGRITKESIKYASKDKGTHTYSYDKKGRLKKYAIEHYMGTSLFDKWTLSYSKYDSHGNPRKQAFNCPLTSEKFTATIKYTYNKKGALTQQYNTYSERKFVYSKFIKTNNNTNTNSIQHTVSLF